MTKASENWSRGHRFISRPVLYEKCHAITSVVIWRSINKMDLT